MKKITYQLPCLELIELEEETVICLNGSGSNENYNEHNYNWS